MATLETYTGSNYIYLNIIKWAFRQKVAEWTEGATKREILDKDWKPTWEIRFEKVYNKITWKITDLYFKELPFWEVLNIGIDNEVYISLMTNSDYYKDFAHKLPFIDLKEKITLIPYEMEVENKNPKTRKEYPTKKKRGLVIIQLWDKITGSAYVEYDEKNKKFIYKNWFPEPDKQKAEKMGSKYWKTYFPEVEYFLVEEVKKVADNFTKIEELPWDEKLTWNNEYEISLEDLPF